MLTRSWFLKRDTDVKVFKSTTDALSTTRQVRSSSIMFEKKVNREHKEAGGSVFSSFNNTFISMLCFVYKEFKRSVDED